MILNKNDIGSRNQGIVEVADILNNLFPKYNEVAKSVIFLFSKY